MAYSSLAMVLPLPHDAIYKMKNNIAAFNPSLYLGLIHSVTRRNNLPNAIVLSPSQNSFKTAVAQHICSLQTLSF